MTKREIKLIIATALIMCVPMIMIAHQKNYSPMPSTAFEWNTIAVKKTLNGEKRQFFQSPTVTLNELECHATTLNPGEIAHQPHQHPEEELTIVKEGTLEVLVNGEYKIVGPGSVIFQSSNQLHTLKNIGTTKAVYHAIKWRSPLTPTIIK